MKSKLLALLQSRDQWSVPILLNLQRPQANAPEVPAVLLNFSQTGAGLKIQLDLLVDRDFQPPVLQREVLRALLLELSYRALPSLPAGAPYVAPPDWLVDGILTLDNESPEVFEGLDSVASSPPGPKNFLAQNPRLLDSQSRALYRACASALVRILLEHENGRPQLNRYIADLPRASVDALSDLRAHFPWLGKDPDLDGKELARKCCPGGQRTEVCAYYVCGHFESSSTNVCGRKSHRTGEESSLNLEETVRASRPNIDTRAATELGQRLTLLGARAHPLLRPVVVDYQLAAELLARKKRHGLSKRLAGSAALREKIAARMSEVDDFMNWYEATQAKTASGVFRDYLHAVDSSEQVPRRRDALSVYLDALETQLQ